MKPAVMLLLIQGVVSLAPTKIIYLFTKEISDPSEDFCVSLMDKKETDSDCSLPRFRLDGVSEIFPANDVGCVFAGVFS